MGRYRRIGTCAVLLAAMWDARAGADVTVSKKPPVVEQKTFDPAHPPTDMPPLKDDEAALTEARFDCAMNLTYVVTERKPAAERCTTVLQVRGVTITLQLKIVIWLPDKVPAKLTAHEEGHRQIDERVYEDAERVARDLAARLDGQSLSGEGVDCAAAEAAVTRAAADQFCKVYLKQIAGEAGRVGDAYDQITAHGTRSQPSEPEAIHQAFAKVERQDHPDHKPPR